MRGRAPRTNLSLISEYYNSGMKSFIGMYFILVLAACSGASRSSPTPTQILPAPAFPSLSTRGLTPPVLAGLPGPSIPDGLGVNIHFVRSNPAQMDAIAAAGFRFVRMDMTWQRIERTPGVYTFTFYDTLVQAMLGRGIRILFILDYANPYYDNNLAPHTEAGRTAFANFAAAAARHYAGDGIIWEIWNEPNLSRFWDPSPNVNDYAALALAAVPAIRQADPQALVVGPAACCLEEPSSWEFLDTLGKLGVLGKFDAVSVHPYQETRPESAYADYERLEQLLDTYSPGRKIPIISSEWGYSVAGSGLTEDQQAAYMVRSWMVNLSSGVELSIWYDWKDDCAATDDPECHFGTVDPGLTPKPAYLAAETMLHLLAGYHYVRRISTPDPADCLYLFSNGDQFILAAWTTSKSHKIALSIPGSELTAITLQGNPSRLTSTGSGFSIPLSDFPQYLILGLRSL